MPQTPVKKIVSQARAAQAKFETATQEVVDELIAGLAWAIIEPVTNRSLAKQAVLETGLGNVEDKIIKNQRKTLGLLRDLKNAISCGIIREIPEQGLLEIARPVGLVGAVTPSTNPIATPLNKTLNALKTHNRIEEQRLFPLAYGRLEPEDLHQIEQEMASRRSRLRSLCLQ